MRLGDFILTNVEPILVEWERFARSLTGGTDMDVAGLRDHAEDILRAAARDMASPQTLREQSEKSKGHGGDGNESRMLDGASKEHAIGRLLSGFNLIEVVSEYRALRASVLRLWRESVPGADERDLEDLTRFNETIDQSLAEAVRSYNDRVEESRELFLATLGHDLRNPLNAMAVSAQIVTQSGQLDGEAADIAARMPAYARVMSTMIDDLLDFTRSRLGRGMPIVPAAMNLEGLCREVLSEFKAAHQDRTFSLQSSGDSSGEWDEARLRQVVSNLIVNAVEHGDESGSIDLSVTGEDSVVMFAVRNRGTPIAADAIPTLFDPFVRGAVRAQTNRSRRTGSVGLGLYIAREVVTAHGGSIVVTSSESEGTVFTVRLPRRISRA